MLKVAFRAMGCQMAALLDREDEQAARALQQVPEWFEEWEQALSRFRPDSEISQLNLSLGQPFFTSPILWEVLQEALSAAEWTSGLVLPTLLNALEQAGYNRSFEQLQAGHVLASSAGINPKGGAIQASWQSIQLDPQQNAVTLPPGMRLDLGGVAKGWAAQQAMLRLSELGPALVDAAGDIACSGPQENGQPWPIAVADPLDAQADLGMLAIGSAGVATSGIDYRRWKQNGIWKHHIIDPRTCQPADTDLLCVTIIAPDVQRAEASAKTVLILGSQAGLSWLEGRPELAALMVFPDGRLSYANSFLTYYWS